MVGPLLVGPSVPLYLMNSYAALGPKSNALSVGRLTKVSLFEGRVKVPAGGSDTGVLPALPYSERAPGAVGGRGLRMCCQNHWTLASGPGGGPTSGVRPRGSSSPWEFPLRFEVPADPLPNRFAVNAAGSLHQSPGPALAPL